MQAYARAAGIMMLVSVVAGGFGEGYAPQALIDFNDPAGTVAALKAQEDLHRLSFAAYLVEAFCDLGIAACFYVLLRPVSRGIAFLTAMLGLFSTALYAACELFYFALPHLLISDAGYLNAFSPDQITALTILSLRLFSYGAGMFLAFYGVGWIVRGWLMIRSGYFPAWLGALMIAGGLAFAAKTFTAVLLPEYSSPYLLFVMAPGGLILGLWLTAFGVNRAKWDARVTSMAA